MRSPRVDPDIIDLAARAETPLDIGRPADAVYSYLADFIHLPEWAHTCLSIEAMAPGPPRVGARFRLQEKQDLHWDKPPHSTIADREGPEYISQLEVTELEPPKRIGWRLAYRGGPLHSVTGEWGFVLEPVSDGITTVRMRARLAGPAHVLHAFVADLLLRGYPVDVIQRQVDRALHNVRTILEGRA